MSLHSLYVPLTPNTSITQVEFPRSNVILIGAQGGSPGAVKGVYAFDLGHGIYAYPNLNAGLLGNGGFNPFLYKIQGNTINIGNYSQVQGMLNVFYVDDVSDINPLMRKYPPLSKFAGIQVDMGGALTIPESTPANQPLANVPTYDFILDLPSANTTIWGMWLNASTQNSTDDYSNYFVKYPTQNGLPLLYMGAQSFMDYYPYIPMHYYSSAQKLPLSFGYNGGNSSTTASISVGLNIVFYYDFETIGKEILRASPFEEYLPIAKPTVKS